MNVSRSCLLLQEDDYLFLPEEETQKATSLSMNRAAVRDDKLLLGEMKSTPLSGILRPLGNPET